MKKNDRWNSRGLMMLAFWMGVMTYWKSHPDSLVPVVFYAVALPVVIWYLIRYGPKANNGNQPKPKDEATK